jgi:hypothetical protein
MTTAATSEIVALVSGKPSIRRAVLEWAAHHVGRGGTVHVVCDGKLSPALTSSVVLTGVLVDTEQLEWGDFRQTAGILAPHGCGWTWQYVLLGASGHALRRARSTGMVAVLPRRSSLLRPAGIRVVRPGCDERSAPDGSEY